MNKHGIFITGTDTGVGKTYVAAGIAQSLRNRGVDVGVMKPVETGCRMRDGRMIPRDARLLARASRTSDSLDLVNPYRFGRPLAPSVAAELEGREIRPGKIVTAYRQLAGRHQYMIVEGAGGIMVPLRNRYTYLDLAQALKLPVVIVARPALGTINHTLLTVAVLKERGLTIRGVVINYAQDRKPGYAEKSNPSVIRSISGVEVLGVIRYGSLRFEELLPRLTMPSSHQVKARYGTGEKP